MKYSFGQIAQDAIDW